MIETFRTDVTRGIKAGVDRESEIIKGFAVVTKGMTKDKRGEFDEDELNKIVKLGNKEPKGMKSRFGHPNMSSTALGTFLGRVKKFRRDNGVVRADLHIDPTAHNTPDGDLASYVMDLAESDSDAFGSSMVIKWDPSYRTNEKGEVLKDKKTGEALPPFIRVEKLRSVDIVDDPAANDSMFGDQFFSDSVCLSADMTAFLDKFLANPNAVEKTISFLQRYAVNEVDTEEVKKFMDFKELTLEQLQAERPDLYDSIYKVGFDAGITEGKKAPEPVAPADNPPVETHSETPEKTPAESETEEPAEKPASGDEPEATTFSQEEVDMIVDEKTKPLEEKVEQLQEDLKKMEAQSAVDKKWAEISDQYKEDDAEEIRGLLLKSELGEALTSDETAALIAKKLGTSQSQLKVSEPVIDGVLTEARKAELRKLGGIKTKVKQE